ncbi:MAG: hypothetical protein HYV95_17350 [Opitutae bacterium]|nr:hypothetical protein [Opitutae bacterium]
MTSLASFRYRNILRANGGPLARVELADITILGKRAFQANACLCDELVAWRSMGAVYGEANGTGVDASPMVARFKAVSEALERWAHMAVLTAGEGGRYGFDVDPSSNGMAAFPGLFARQARRAAQLEASERFNLLSWWEGYLPALETESPWPEVRAVVLCSEVPGVTVILFRRSAAHGHYAYGHAAGSDFTSACESAAMEMERHDHAVGRYLLAHAGAPGSAMPATAHPIERRSVFFSTPEGHELFLGRLRSRPPHAARHPRVIFDGAVPGPWSRYADVWRVAYEPPSERFLGRDERYFFW